MNLHTDLLIADLGTEEPGPTPGPRPGAPFVPSGDEDPVTDVPDSDSPASVPPDNPSGLLTAVGAR